MLNIVKITGMFRYFFLFPLCVSAPAFSKEVRDYCPDRPGLGTPACVMDAGRVSVELGALAWDRDGDSAFQTDMLTSGDILVRAGLTDSLEAQFGWTAYGHVRTRDRATGIVNTQRRSGDVTIALRQNLRNPDGSGTSVAVMPYASINTGRVPIGAGDWGAGVILPVNFSLPANISLSLTPQIAAAVDGDGHGRHLAYGSVIGLGTAITGNISGSVELGLTRDHDPSGHSTQALAGLSFGWQPQDNLQIDAGANIGLNRNSGDFGIYTGVSRRF